MGRNYMLIIVWLWKKMLVVVSSTFKLNGPLGPHLHVSVVSLEQSAMIRLPLSQPYI